MIKIGVDILQISRVEEALAIHKFTENVFTQGEMNYLDKKLEKGEIRGYKFFECVAGLFCAKEAVLKAIGIGIIYKSVLKDVEICHKDSGEPFAIIHGKLAKEYKTLVGKEISVSITHDGGYASSSCVIDV